MGCVQRLWHRASTAKRYVAYSPTRKSFKWKRETD
nr:MAG TPA: hypothetical protein [Caudoviricetes sp.]